MIAEGTAPPDIVSFLLASGLERPEIDHLLHECGIQFSKYRNFNDGITDARRRELQELSTRED